MLFTTLESEIVMVVNLIFKVPLIFWLYVGCSILELKKNLNKFLKSWIMAFLEAVLSA